MKSIQHLIVGILTIVVVTACGKSSSEQAKESADSSIAELKASAKELTSMGSPSVTWSDEKLTHYENLISSCESNANRIEALDGKNGVTVYGTWSLPQLRSSLSQLRGYANQTRSEKARIAQLKQEQQRLDAVTVKYRGHLEAVQKAGTPTSDWSIERLDQYDAEITGIETTAAEITSITGATVERTEMLRSARSLRDIIKSLRAAKVANQPAA